MDNVQNIRKKEQILNEAVLYIYKYILLQYCFVEVLYSILLNKSLNCGDDTIIAVCSKSQQ
jgi:hypothetical protein